MFPTVAGDVFQPFRFLSGGHGVFPLVADGDLNGGDEYTLKGAGAWSQRVTEINVVIFIIMVILHAKVLIFIKEPIAIAQAVAWHFYFVPGFGDFRFHLYRSYWC